MALLSASVLLYAAGVVAAVVGAVYIWFQKKYKYWDNRGITHTNPSFPIGDLHGFRKTKTMGEILKDLYNKYSEDKIIGFWGVSAPLLLARDPDLIKNITVKDFSSFHDRGLELDTELDPLGKHLFGMKGQEWRNLRVKLTPTFTSGKMKMMFPTAAAAGDTLVKVLNKEVDKGGVVEVKEYLARYTTDVIASTAFGLNINCLENPDNEFRKNSKVLLRPESLTSKIANILAFFAPKLLSILRIRFLPKDISDFFIAAVDDTIKTRESKNIQRNDFMQLLIQIKNKGYIEDADKKNQSPTEFKFTTEDAAAQAFLFFIAGFETSSSTMQFALYELALQPDLQSQVQAEMDKANAKHGGKLTYEGMMEMDLLDRVVAETLRKYPIADFLMREVAADYPVPDTDIVLKKKEQLFISLTGLHHDPKYYPNPEKFDPDRFLPEEKEKRNSYTYMPFGEGPRSCIGNRFGLMQTKIGLIIILSAFNVEVCEKTPIPMVLDPAVDLLTPLGGMHLRLKKK